MGLYHQGKPWWIQKIWSKIRCSRIQPEKGYRLWRNLLPYRKHHLNTHLDANGGAIWSDCPPTAYLHAPIDYEVFVGQPGGFKTNKLVYRLNKSLYGLKQSGRNWNKMLYECLIRNDFIQNPANYCVYMKQNERLLIVSWVDDLIIAANKVISLSNVKKMLMSEFKMKDLGKLNHFIGLYFHITQGCVKMNQNKYLGRVLERFDMSNYAN